MRKLLFILLGVLGFFSLYKIQAETQKKITLTLYYSPSCPYCKEVFNYLRKIKKNIPLKNVKKSSKAKEELKKIGGVLEVPCLVINNHALYKSKAIIQWLNEHQDDY